MSAWSSMQITSAPSRANNSAVARPRPQASPAITAVFPLKFIVSPLLIGSAGFRFNSEELCGDEFHGDEPRSDELRGDELRGDDTRWRELGPLTVPHSTFHVPRSLSGSSSLIPALLAGNACVPDHLLPALLLRAHERGELLAAGGRGLDDEVGQALPDVGCLHRPRHIGVELVEHRCGCARGRTHPVP